MQPGQTITPGSPPSSPLDDGQQVSLQPQQTISAPSTAPVQPGVMPVQPQPTTPSTTPPQPEAEPFSEMQTPTPQPQLEAEPFGDSGVEFGDADDEIELTWTASEFVNREKSPAWYGILAGLTISVSVVVYLLTKDITASVMIVVAALAFGILAARKPRVQRYEVHPEGITINQQFHSFTDYRAFSIVDEGAVRSVIMLPLKRFGMGLTLYSPPDIEDSVYEAIGNHLPFLENYNDPLDSVLRKLHF